MLTLFDTRYWDYTPKHFHEKLTREHGFKLSYNWVRLALQSHGRVQPASRRGAHRRRRPRHPMPGMMLHQDGSSHEWVPDQWWDLIVTMDDATSEIYSAFFVPEEGTMSTFQGLGEVPFLFALPCSRQTRKSFGDMTRKLSDTSSHKSPQFLGTSSFRNPSMASQNSLKVA